MKPVIAWELKQRRSYLLWWSVATACLLLLLLATYPSIHAQADKLNAVLNQLPAALRELKTGGTSVDISSPVGYLNSQVFYVTLPLLQIIMAVGLGSSLLARDEQTHTIELLLARPLSRGRLLAAKAAAGVLCMALVALVATMITILLAPIVKLHIGTGYLIITNVYCLLFAMSFGAIAFALTALSNRTRRVATPLAVFASFGGYILATMGGLTHYLQTPAKFLPYHYFSPQHILQGQSVPGLNIYLLGIFIVCAVAAWLGFRSRDIY